MAALDVIAVHRGESCIDELICVAMPRTPDESAVHRGALCVVLTRVEGDSSA